MSNVYSPDKIGKKVIQYNPYFSKDAMLGYSSLQEEIFNSSLGIVTQTAIGSSIIDRIVTGVVGKGLTPMAAPERIFLNWTEEEYQRFQSEAEAFFRMYTSADYIDYYGKDSFFEIQQQALRSIFIFGDILLHRGYKKKGERVFPYMQLISGNFVRNKNITDTKRNKGGIIYAPNSDKEIGYEIVIIDENLNDTGSSKEVKKFNSYGFKEFDLIVLKKLNEKTVRGIPLLTPVKSDILILEKIKDNYMTKMMVQNLFTLFLKKTEGAPDNGASFKEKVVGLGYGPAAQEEKEDKRSYLGAGVVLEGEPGESAEVLQSSQQGADFATLFRTILENISAACYGLPYEVLLSSFNSSFSASRASVNMAEKAFSTIRSEFVKKFNNPVWEMIVDYGIRIGLIHAPGYTFGENLFIDKAILACTWTGVTPIQVDPVKEVKAYVTGIDAGICSREFAIRNLYGLDGDETLERIATENKKLEAMGFELKNNTADNTYNTNNEEEENEKKEDEE